MEVVIFMEIILDDAEKAALNKKFKKQGSTKEIINAWLDYEGRLLSDEIENLFTDFLNRRKIFNEIGREEVQKEFDELEK